MVRGGRLAMVLLFLGCVGGGRGEKAEEKPEEEPPTWKWTLVLDEEPGVELARDGTLYAVADTAVYAIADGKIIWQHASQGTERWVLQLASGCLLTAEGKRLVCLDPANGAPRWSVAEAIEWKR